MNKKDYTNLACEQTLGTVEFARHMNNSISMEKLAKTLDTDKVKKAKKIIISGCGDSWLAGVAAKPVFEAMTDKEVEVMRAVELSRYLNPEKMSGEDAPIMFFISISGGVARVIEGAERGTKYGATTVAITQNVEGGLALACKAVLPLDMTPLERTPGISSYIASTMALMNCAMYIGMVTGKITETEFALYKKDLLDYCLSYGDCLERIENHMFDLAQRWENMKAWDFVGDYADWATAFFSGAKMVEAFGAIMTCDDSEDWNHINAFTLEPEKMATMFFANENSPSFGRLLETMTVAADIGRAAVVVTDADPAVIPAGIEVISVPKSKYGWEAPLMQHLPSDMLCGFVAALKKTQYYRQDRTDVWGSDTWTTRLKKEGTKIVVK